MNIKDHLCKARVYLDLANKKVNSEDYPGAQIALASAYAHNRELLDHVQKLVVSKADVKLSAGES